MTEKDITRILRGQMVDEKTLVRKLEAVTTQQEAELNSLLRHLQAGGIVGEHQGSYYLLEDQHLFLARVSMKTRNFVILKKIPGNDEAKVSGREATGLLVGDLVYAKEFQQGIFHCLSYFKAVDTLKGRYSLTRDGKEQLLVDYLNAAGYTVLVGDKDKDLGEINQGDLIDSSIESFDGTMITVKLDKLLVHADEVGSDISMIIRQNDAPIDFPEAVTEEAKALPQEISQDDKADRHDFTDHCVVTIDGEDAHDFDDAVEGKRLGTGYEVVVHIADVTDYVKPNHPLDDEAIARGTSIYVADRVVPMLPFELSNGICSLNPGVERLVLSVTMDVDSFGNVFKTTIEKGVIRSHGRLTYTQVNDLWSGKESDLSDEIKETLMTLKDCSEAIRKRRERQGAMKLDSTELKFKLDENGEPTDVTKQVQGPAEKMIEDLMIIANCEVAKALRDAKIPVLYRVHEFPPKEKIAAFRDFLRKMDRDLSGTFPKEENLSGARLNDFLSSIKDDSLRSAISYMMLRAMAKARYSPDELGHFGLAEMEYCHFTSPIRRYPDDIIHRLVKDYLLDHKDFDYDEVFAHLEDLGDVTSAEEVRADVIERTVDDLESAKYMAQHIGELYHAKITSMVQRGMFVQTDLGIEGFLAYHCMHGDFFRFDERSYAVVGRDSDISFTVGTPIDIKVLAADPATQEVDFATPEFYDQYAVDLSEEERENLSLNGVHLESAEEFMPMTGHPDFPDEEDDDRSTQRDGYRDEDERRDEDRDGEERDEEETDYPQERNADESGERENIMKKKAVETKEEVKPVEAAVEEKPAKKAKKTTKKTAKKATKAEETLVEEAVPAVEEKKTEVEPEVPSDAKAEEPTLTAEEENQAAALSALEENAPKEEEAEDKDEEKFDDEEEERPHRDDDDGFRPSPDQWKEVDIIRAVEAKFDKEDPASAKKIADALAILGIDDAEHQKLERFTKPRDRGFGDRGGRGGFGGHGRGGYGHDRGGFGGGHGGYGHDRGFGGRGGYGHDRGGFGGGHGGYGHHDGGGYGHRDFGDRDQGSFDSQKPYSSDRPESGFHKDFHSDDRRGGGYSDHRGYGHSGGFSGGRGGYGHDRGGFGGGDRGGYGHRDGGYGHDRGGFGGGDRGGYGHSDHTSGYGHDRGGYGHKGGDDNNGGSED
jgi:ribonuclease R